MGASQSSVSAKERAAASKFLEEPIQRPKREEEQSPFPIPTGQEFDAIDRIAAELPNVIDDESRQQVEDYKQACDNGNGPVVACFATGEYLSLFERKHKEAAELYRNVCFRGKNDKSPNSVLVDGTMAYPAGCFNLAKMLMTGKGGILFDRAEAYQLFDRACRGGHGGACFLQAQILCTRPETLGKGVPHDPQKAMGKSLIESSTQARVPTIRTCILNHRYAILVLTNDSISIQIYTRAIAKTLGTPSAATLWRSCCSAETEFTNLPTMCLPKKLVVKCL
jgi:TPR repeat protein